LCIFSDSIPQERTPVHLRASKSSMHPALMEKGRAIPQPHIGPRQHGSPTPHSFKVNFFDTMYIYKLENPEFPFSFKFNVNKKNLPNFIYYLCYFSFGHMPYIYIIYL